MIPFACHIKSFLSSNHRQDQMSDGKYGVKGPDGKYLRLRRPRGNMEAIMAVLVFVSYGCDDR